MEFPENLRSFAEAVRGYAKSNIPAGHFGHAEEFGDYAAFLCGVNSGFVTGQNIMLDGGQYPGLV